MPIKLSIIIPHKDDSNLSKVISALTPQLTPEIEVIIVDDASTNPPKQLPDNFHLIQLKQNIGAYGARNHGAKYASGTILGFLDSDTIPSPNWVSTAIKHHIPKTISGGPVKLYYNDPNNISPDERLDNLIAFNMKKYASRGFMGAGNMLINKSLFHEKGGFDASYTGGGDTEFGNRANLKVNYIPELSVSHRAYNKKSIRNKLTRMTENWVQRCEIEGWGTKGLIQGLKLGGIPKPYKQSYVLTRAGPKPLIALYKRSINGAILLKKAYEHPKKRRRMMLPGEALKYIRDNTPPGGNILEYGSGAGSAHLATRFKVTCIEHHQQFLNAYAGINYIYAPITNGWYGPHKIPNTPFQTVIIDGPCAPTGREGFLNIENLNKIPLANLYLIDDTQRETESEIAVKLAKQLNMKQIHHQTKTNSRFTVLC